MTYNIDKDKILTVNLQSTVLEAKSLIDQNEIRYITVVDGEDFIGLLFLDVLLGYEDEILLENIKHDLDPVFLREDFTLFDWLKVSSLKPLDIIPIVAVNDMVLLGFANADEILNQFQNTGLLVESSTVLVIKKSSNLFSYSEVFQIAESNSTKIFASYINYSDENETEIVLNMYHTGLNELLQSFRRYDYEIVSYHEEDLHHETLRANSEYFTKYLTV